jgi:hypothetical protein
MIFLFEEGFEGTDYLEIALSREEISDLKEKGVVQNFTNGLNRKKKLNIFIRPKNERESR